MNSTKSIIAITTLFTLVSCNSSKVTTNQNEKQKTYAEISVKEGGKWNGKKYEGGTFKNINQLQVPENHTDHSFYIRYEGPGWESNKIGYRLYLDWRNAIDIFGKLTDEMVLPKVGQDGFDSYHNMDEWGADILKVGKGLGIGSIGRMVNNEMNHFKEVDATFTKVENFNNKSVVSIDYTGWKTNEQKTNLKSELSIFPDERYTKHTIQLSEALNGICTGIVNLYNLPMIQKGNDSNKWAYIATYGKQTLFDDNLGMAIFYEVIDAEKVYQGPHDHLIQFKPTTQPIDFYFLGAWDKEVGGITTEKEFFEYLDTLLNKLNTTNKLN
ncbi:DUF4861 family protein [Flavobacterium orientale]|uniref:DUF4861 domain-containing protein n=1 Tax=Flavobacterium orientale TaxID=1756020 RepID=A0A917DAS7_9FLAO|nr:DUF4861 family protein [Flavobacterium orientale]GGD23996.1 hypothetical protein GCM10011343_12710 [Flavobacterium orientale]